MNVTLGSLMDRSIVRNDDNDSGAVKYGPPKQFGVLGFPVFHIKALGLHGTKKSREEVEKGYYTTGKMFVNTDVKFLMVSDMVPLAKYNSAGKGKKKDDVSNYTSSLKGLKYGAKKDDNDD